MIDRREFGFAGLSALTLVALQASASGQDKPNPPTDGHSEHDEMFKSCAKACADCQRRCNSCASHCARRLAQGKKDHLATLMSCRDCAIICSAAAQVVAGGGPYSKLICEACAGACNECAKACEKFPDDNHMKTCAEECRKCEAECRAMMKHPAK